MNKTNIKRIATCGMFAALAYIVMLLIRFPIFSAAEYLKLDFKDSIILLCGFIFGPFSAIVISIIVSFFEMLTASTTGFIGFIMNALSSITFTLIPSLIYAKKRNIKAVLLGLLISICSVCAFMTLWNYLFTPIYTGMPRDTIKGMLLPIIIPFNVIKYTFNSALTLVLYRPIIQALNKAKLLPDYESSEKSTKTTIFVIILSIAVSLLCILTIFLLNK